MSLQIFQYILILCPIVNLILEITYEILSNLFSRIDFTINDVWHCLLSFSGFPLMIRIFNISDLHSFKNFSDLYIRELEDELSRRSDNQLRDKLKSFKDVSDEIDNQISNHHQIRIVS